MHPIDIRPVGDKEILITWEDHHRSLFEYFYLRFHCPCAACIDEHTGKRLIQREQILSSVASTKLEGIGNYGVRFFWSDGHHTGIYSFDHLRELCPCEACKKTARSAS